MEQISIYYINTIFHDNQPSRAGIVKLSSEDLTLYKKSFHEKINKTIIGIPRQIFKKGKILKT